MAAKENAQRLKQIQEDRDLIEREGGPAVLAKKLMLTEPRAASRVHNWTIRGIPPSIKLMYPEIFLKGGVRALKTKAKGGKRK